jgi:hypothetical protein
MASSCTFLPANIDPVNEILLISMWLASIAPALPSPVMMLITPTKHCQYPVLWRKYGLCTWGKSSFFDQIAKLQESKRAFLTSFVDDSTPNSKSRGNFERKEDRRSIPGAYSRADSDGLILDNLALG